MEGALAAIQVIDDHLEGRGQEAFKGRLIHFGSTDYPDWASVLDDLISV